MLIIIIIIDFDVSTSNHACVNNFFIFAGKEKPQKFAKIPHMARGPLFADPCTRD